MAKTIQLTESELKNMIIESVQRILNEGIDPTNDSNWSNYPITESYKKINEASASHEEKTIVLSIDDFRFNNKELDEWMDDNWENLPTDDVEITINFRYIPEESGDYWTPSSGGYIEIITIEFNDNPLMQYLKQELSEKLLKVILSTIELYVKRNVVELVQYQEYNGPDPDNWREEHLSRKYRY